VVRKTKKRDPDDSLDNGGIEDEPTGDICDDDSKQKK